MKIRGAAKILTSYGELESDKKGPNEAGPGAPEGCSHGSVGKDRKEGQL